MIMIVSGAGISNSPDEHMLNTNVLIGKVLKNLYETKGDFSWYGYYMFSVYFMSAWFFLYAVLMHKFSSTRIFLFLMYFVLIELYSLMSMQYTVAAFSAAQSGIFMFLVAVERKRRVFLIASAILLLLSSLIRVESFILALILAFPLLAIALIKARNGKKLAITAVVFFAVLLLSLAARQYNVRYYEKNEAWKDFFEVMDLTKRFVDYKHAVYGPDTRRIFDNAGWSENDYYVFMSWFFADTEVFSKERMKEILYKFSPYRKIISPEYFSARLKNIAANMKFVLIASLFFMLFIKKTDFLSVASAFLVSLILTMLLLVFLKLPPWVYFSLFFFVSSATLFFADKDFDFKSNRLFKALIVGASAIALVGVLVAHLGESRENLSGQAEVKQAMERLNGVLPGKKLFVLWAGFPFERLVLPFDDTGYLSKYSFYWRSGLQRTPLQNGTLGEFGIVDIYSGLYEKENIYLLLPGDERDRYFLSYYSQYIKEHRGVDISLVNVYRDSFCKAYKAFRKPR